MQKRKAERRKEWLASLPEWLHRWPDTAGFVCHARPPHYCLRGGE